MLNLAVGRSVDGSIAFIYIVKLCAVVHDEMSPMLSVAMLVPFGMKSNGMTDSVVDDVP